MTVVDLAAAPPWADDAVGIDAWGRLISGSLLPATFEFDRPRAFRGAVAHEEFEGFTVMSR